MAQTQILSNILTYFLDFRKNALLVNNIPALVGSVFMFLSYHTKHSSLLIVGRLIIGVNSGMDPGVSIQCTFRIFGWKVEGN